MSRPATWCARRVSAAAASKPRLLVRPPTTVTGWSSIFGCRRASFASARRERGLWRGFPQSCAAARRFGSFLKLATTQQFCNFCLREAAQRGFFGLLPRRLAVKLSTPSQQQLRRVNAAHGRFIKTALLFGPKPVLTAPVISAETATNQQHGATARLGSVRNRLRNAHARAAPRGKKTAQALRAARDEGSRRTHGCQGSTGGGGSTKNLLAKAPNFWTGQR